MGVKIFEKEKQFHLFNSKISYLIGECRDGEIGQIYFGKRINENQIILGYQTLAGRPYCNPAEYDESYTKELACLEYPAFGNGDMRGSAYEIRQANGSRVTNLVYKSHVVYEGKKPIPGLPASYVNTDSEATTLEIRCVDEVAKVEVTLYYTIFEDYSIITRHVSFKNVGNEEVKLTKALSCCIDLPDHEYDLMQFEGAWGRERYPHVRSIEKGIISIESMRGHSSANFNPFVIMKRRNTDEFQGEAIGIHLVYSGNFIAKAEVDNFDKLRFTMGINPNWFVWPLDKGEVFDTPEVIISYTKEGLNDLSQNIHKFMNNNLVRSPYKNKPRPILLNNWEATEMNFDEGKIINIAKKGKEAGIELFVLDDGWFGKRNDDRAGLGDWFANTDKLPDGITGLAKKINDLGMDFGLWIEPEMVNPDSDLYRAHPDWVLAVPDRRRTLGRHQMVLDFSKPEVVDNVYYHLYDIISTANISYIKWDMNRSITECFSQGVAPEYQGMVYHKYILGVYSLYERLIKDFPHILFESCASGGGRFDAGMLYYAPQAWCSDDTDGHERVKIQYGTSYGYPLVSMGSHVSASPNGQTGRVMAINDRANIAYFGTFGYELDLNEVSEEDFEQVKNQVVFMKKYRGLFQYGTLYRLQSPFEKNYASWMVVSEDKKQAIVVMYKGLNTQNTEVEYIKLQGLEPDTVYTINDNEKMYGDFLMERGLGTLGWNEPWYRSGKDFTSRMFILNAE
ncbi:alpha-galactosidase [Pseudobutyrivibrio xylanivorans]|uniref:Alpha-galactosidase n=1 Tax=Pseudobutyrivibrio xylanivorans TaxID=185007 RepID=A0A5P6VQ82_PSEXY|nr:alpha-galactosidase [Pseudobutyrivibrio xylanivorans]QFJ54630.1 alpha-galactosidase [Pseudobutyrivibrio xylanivorans]